MEKIRTYEEAVEITVNWWVEKMTTPMNQNNGDDSRTGGLAFMLGNMLAASAQNEITPEKIIFFKESLREQLIENKNGYSFLRELTVDYDPNQILYTACRRAGINTSCLPIKTFTRINNDNSVEGRYQYGGEFFTI